MFTDLNDTCGSKAYDCLLLKLETASNQSLSIDQFKASIPLLENVFLSHLLIEANGSKRQFGKALKHKHFIFPVQIPHPIHTRFKFPTPGHRL